MTSQSTESVYYHRRLRPRLYLEQLEVVSFPQAGKASSQTFLLQFVCFLTEEVCFNSLGLQPH